MHTNDDEIKAEGPEPIELDDVLGPGPNGAGGAVVIPFVSAGTGSSRARGSAHAKPEPEPGGWPTPIDLWGKLEPPALPRGLLPSVIEEFAFAQGELTGADPGGFAAAALCVCGAAAPDEMEVQVKQNDPSWRESTRLWVALVGLASKKKSPTFKETTKPIVKLDFELAKKHAAELQEYNALSAEDKKDAEPPRNVRLCIDNVTVEYVQEVLKDSPQGILSLQDELSGWFGGMDKYSAGRGSQMDRGFYLRTYNGGPYGVGRIGRGGFIIPNLSMSLLGGFKPSVARDIANQTIDDGLIQRLCPIMLGPATLGKDIDCSGPTAAYQGLVQRLVELREAFGGVVLFTPEAQTIRRQYEQRHLDLMSDCEGIYPKLASHIGKYDGIFARLCLLWYLIERPGDVITASIAETLADVFASRGS